MRWRPAKNILFALKTGLLFALLVIAVLAGTLFLFMHVAGNQLVMELGRLRAFDGVMTAQSVEAMLEDPRYDEEVLRQHLMQEGTRRDLELTFYPMASLKSASGARDTSSPTTASRPHAPGTEEGSTTHRLPLSVSLYARRHLNYPFQLEVQDRSCTFFGPPSFGIQVPIFRQGQQVAHLVVSGSQHARAVHHAFRTGILRIGLVALVAITALVIYLTSPLRRMSQSMDRIAAGELDHRVAVRGRDEVAVMGQSFNAMADRISAMLRSQKELVASISHELRSPLARMKLSLELLRRGPKSQRHVEGLEQEIDELNALVGELLLASRFDLDAVPLKMRNLDIREIAQQALSSLVDETDPVNVPEKDITLSFDLEVLQVHADPTLLSRIFTNLLQNARRYAPRSVVKISTRRRGTRIDVTVEDQGPGVEPEHLKHLFEPFYRVDPSRSRSTGAIGLGLMIVQRAVRAHGGSVSASTHPGRGLVVKLDLAAAPPP